MAKPTVGITIGDPSGIGPEITLKAIMHPKIRKVCKLVVIGSKTFLPGLKKSGKKTFYDFVEVPCPDLNKVVLGKFSSKTGLASYKFIAKAVELLKSRKIDALVTAPISKEALNLAGILYSGHTELLADFTQTKDFAMLMVANNFRTAMVTRHMPLQYACKNISAQNIVSITQLARKFLINKLKIKNPKIGICALNPHAGEGGLLGREEEDFIIPAIKKLKNKNIYVEGPIPADSAWLKMKNGKFDFLITMYHDQAMIPLKILEPEKIVNITIGLPFIRTSPGHGTAFDIAGKGKADPSSMIEAIKVAADLSRY